MWKQLFLVAIGGAIGTILRFGTSIIWIQKEDGFPYATFVVNIIGSLLIGILLVIGEKFPLEYRLSLTAGFCGGLTTFSAFSLQTFKLLIGGHALLAGAYVFFSILISLSMVFLGYYLAIRTLHQ